MMSSLLPQIILVFLHTKEMAYYSGVVDNKFSQI